MKKSKKKHKLANIILITHGTGGDVLPFIKIGKSLKKNGHNVTLFTHYLYEEIAINSGLNFIAIDNEKEYANMSNDICMISDAIDNLSKYIEYNKKYYGSNILYKEYNLISKFCNKKNTLIIFRHRSSLSGQLVAEKNNCVAVPVFLSPNYISHLELHEQLIGKEMVQEINEVRNKIGLEEINSWTDWMCSAYMKLALWPDWFIEKDEIKEVNGLFNIGFTSNKNKEKNVPEKCYLEFIKKYKNPILITAGTSKLINPDFYKVAIEGCRLAAKPAIAVIPYEEFVPHDIPKDILCLKSLPISKVMSHISAIIHHGGIGTLSEAIEFMVPQIILPHMIDRPDNAQRAKKLGIARVVQIYNWNPQIISKEIHTIESNTFRNMYKKNLSDLNIFDFEERLNEFINSINRKKILIDISTINQKSTKEETVKTDKSERNNHLSNNKRKELIKDILKQKRSING